MENVKEYVFTQWLKRDNERIVVEADSIYEAETKARKFGQWTLEHRIYSITKKWKKQTEPTP